MVLESYCTKTGANSSTKATRYCRSTSICWWFPSLRRITHRSKCQSMRLWPTFRTWPFLVPPHAAWATSSTLCWLIWAIAPSTKQFGRKFIWPITQRWCKCAPLWICHRWGLLPIWKVVVSALGNTVSCVFVYPNTLLPIKWKISSVNDCNRLKSSKNCKFYRI